jgi:hypothetical protein
VGTEGFVNRRQFRSVRVAQPPNEMSGYQADIGAGHSGSLYDESRRRTFWLARGRADQAALEKPGDWNRYGSVVVEGRAEPQWQKGHVRRNDQTVKPEGLIALQITVTAKPGSRFATSNLIALPGYSHSLVNLRHNCFLSCVARSGDEAIS